MLDRLHLFIPFASSACTFHGFSQETTADGQPVKMSLVDLKTLRMRMQGDVVVDEDGNTYLGELRHPWESLPSSHTPLAFKVFGGGFGFRRIAGIELKASPAKLLQGHNLFGPVNIRQGGQAMFRFLCAAYPQLADKLDFDEAQVQALDCTYSARMENERTAQQALDALRSISKGQTKSRGDNYKETAYYGAKNSRLKKLKIYLKQYEYQTQIKDLERLAKAGGVQSQAARRTLAVMQEPRLLEWSKHLLRFEATVQKRFLERRGIPTNFNQLCDYQVHLQQQNRCLIRELWQEATTDIFKACQGMTMTNIDDESVLNALLANFTTFTKRGHRKEHKARLLFNTYRNIANYGFDEVKASMPYSTFMRHIAELTTCGISCAALQKMRAIKKDNVVPLIRFLEIDFSAQRPAWYQEPNLDHVMTDFDRYQEQEAANEYLPAERAQVIQLNQRGANHDVCKRDSRGGSGQNGQIGQPLFNYRDTFRDNRPRRLPCSGSAQTDVVQQPSVRTPAGSLPLFDGAGSASAVHGQQHGR